MSTAHRPREIVSALSTRLADLPGGRVRITITAVFWLWLVARLIADTALPAVTGDAGGAPFVSKHLFETGATTFGELAGSLGILGVPFTWVAGVCRFFADAVVYLPTLAQGVWVTILLTLISIALGFVIAVPLSVARVYGGRAVRWLSLSYTELIRGTPLLAQLFVLYYATSLTQLIRELPAVGAGLVPAQAFWVAVISFTLNSAAYQSEYLRAALDSVDSGQLTAAQSLGLSKLEGIRYVVLPQGLRLSVPGWTNELIYLIKYSSLASFITVPELFNRTTSIASETYQYTALFTLGAVLYLGLVLSASIVMEYVEEKTAVAGVGQHAR